MMKKTSPILPSRYFCSLLLLTLSGFGLMISCKNDIETIQALTNKIDLPDLSGFNIEMSYTDSGILKGKIIAPEVNQYINREDPYYEFPKGMKVVFYDAAGNASSYIQAKYAIYYTKTQLWEARNQVIGEKTTQGERLETEQMFWDQREKQIYSDKYAKYITPTGIFIGENGFDAREDLSKIRMNGYSGTINVTDIALPEE